MFVVHIASELAPVAKVGGLGDVVYGLARETEIRGNDVEIILPKYDCMRYDHIYGLQEVHHDLWVPWGSGSIRCTVWFGFVHGRKVFFIEPHSPDRFFERGGFYGFKDEAVRFAFFSRAALEFLLKSGKRPDIIHCHDWQTGLVPVLLFEIYQFIGMDRQRVCYSIHNFGHQGVTGSDVAAWAGLGHHHHVFTPERLQHFAKATDVNFMKGGIVYSNFVTTVSPRHAWEARHTEQGRGLQDTLNTHHMKFGGILNGVDYDVWNPAKDAYIPFPYQFTNLDNKYRNKDALRDRLLLRREWKPLVTYIGRLDAQKGVHLIEHAIFRTLELGGQFVLLGSSPDPAINARFWGLKNHLNDNPDVHLELGFSEELAHLIYAGADLLVMPSMYEPCGLSQMIALKYGTIPVVRAVGGLADTVFDRDHGEIELKKRNGYTFHQDDPPALNSALDRAIGLWFNYPPDFRKLTIQAMCYDNSWNQPGNHYLNVYEYIRVK